MGFDILYDDDDVFFARCGNCGLLESILKP